MLMIVVGLCVGPFAGGDGEAASCSPGAYLALRGLGNLKAGAGRVGKGGAGGEGWARGGVG